MSALCQKQTLELDDTYLAPLGRLLLSSLFIWAGYTKLFVFGPGGTAHYMDSVHIPLPGLVAWVAIIVDAC
jgi:uncharacterized membrane protein YphA (DoxX/SURF4 family)